MLLSAIRPHGFSVARIVLCLLVMMTWGAGARSADAEPVDGSRITHSAAELVRTDRVPGVDFAEGLSQITGTAISPLLGVTGVGVLRYYRTPPALRAALPWFCHPGVWGAGLLLLGVCFFKDSIGSLIPILKKPLDVAELIENKISALVASTAFVPLIALEMARQMGGDVAVRGDVSGVSHAAFLSLGWSSVGWVAVPFAVASFLIVWMASHAINVLIVLSPFGPLDALLKLLRTGFIGVVMACYALSPWLGVAVSMTLLCASMMVAPLAFRVTVFGMILSVDLLWTARGKRHATVEAPHGFLVQRVNGAPLLCMGRVVRGGGGVEFRYRRFLILPERRVNLGNSELTIKRGTFYPSVVRQEGAWTKAVIWLPPRYRGSEEQVSSFLGCGAVLESRLERGWQAVRMWWGSIRNPA